MLNITQNIVWMRYIFRIGKNNKKKGFSKNDIFGKMYLFVVYFWYECNILKLAFPPLVHVQRVKMSVQLGFPKRMCLLPLKPNHAMFCKKSKFSILNYERNLGQKSYCAITWLRRCVQYSIQQIVSFLF